MPALPHAALDKVAATSAGVVAASWPAFLSYMFFVPTYICGPILTASDYMAQQQQAGGDGQLAWCLVCSFLSFFFFLSFPSLRLRCPSLSPHHGFSAPRWGWQRASSLSLPLPPTHLQAVDCAPAGQRASRDGAGRSSSSSQPWPAGWRRTLMELLLWVAVLEGAKRTFLADGFLLPTLGAQPWHAWCLQMAVLQALFLQSWIPWTLARLCSTALGVRTVDDAPVSFLSSSVSVRQFWRSFHVSWYRWLCLYIYWPFGGGVQATLAVLAASTALHGGRG